MLCLQLLSPKGKTNRSFVYYHCSGFQNECVYLSKKPWYKIYMYVNVFVCISVSPYLVYYMFQSFIILFEPKLGNMHGVVELCIKLKMKTNFTL